MRFDQTDKTDAFSVLIVDDTTANLKLLTEILADDGYVVRPATNGELALRSVKAKLPAIILLDVRMPDMDGYEVCRRLKADINTSQVPVIFISALDDEHSKVKGFEVGGVDFITKPFRKEEVLARVKTHIDLRNIQLELELQKNRLVEEIEERKFAQEKLNESEEQFRTTLYGIGDGVITTDDLGRIKLMNQVAEQLTGWTQSEAQGMILEEVFRIINEQTRAKVEIPVRKVLREGVVVGLANHTLLIAKDGTERPIADSGAPIRNSNGKITGVVLVFRDQTEERNAENILKQSEERFRNIFEHSPIGMSMTKVDGTLSVNRAFCEMLGYTDAELVNKHWTEISHKDDEQLTKDMVAELLAGTRVNARFEKRYIHKKGNIVWTDVSTFLERDNNCNPQYFITSVNDITKRKNSEENLMKFKIGLENSNDAIFITDINGNIEFINPAFESVYGYCSSEAIGKTPRILKSGLLSQSDYEIFWNTLLSKKSILGELTNKTKDGRLISVDESTNPILNDKGEIIGFISINRDIAERKKTENALRESEEKFRTLADFTPLAICIYQDDLWVYINPAAEKMCGYSAEELYRSKYWEFVAPEYQDLIRNNAQKRLSGTSDGNPYEFKVITKNGDVRWVYLSGSSITYKERPAGIITVFDITERKKAEEAVLEANQKMDAFFNQSLDGFFFMMLDEPIEWNEMSDKDSLLDYAFTHQRITKINQAMLDQYVAQLSDFQKLTPTNLFAHDIEQGKSEWRKLFDFGKLHTETDERKLNGEQIFIEGDYICLYDAEGRITGHFGIQRDITQAKKAIAGLEDSEKKFRTLIESSNDGISLLDLQGNILFANPRKAEMIGVASYHELIGKNAFTMLTPEYQLRFSGLTDEFMSKGYLRNVEAEVVRTDGSSFWGDFNLSLVADSSGTPSYIMDSMRDITERKEAVEQIRQSETELNRAQQVAHVGNWIWNIKDDSLIWSDEMYRIFGVDKKSFSGNLNEVIQSRIHPDDQEKVLNSNLNIINELKPIPLEYRVVWPDQSVHTVWAEAGSLELDRDGKPHYLRGIVKDISEQKQSMAVIESERKLLRTLIDNLPVTVYVKDREGRKIVANTLDLTTIGIIDENEVIGKTDLELFDNEVGRRGYEDDLNVIGTGRPVINREEYFLNDNGEKIWLLTSKMPLFGDEGKPNGLVGIGRDITQIKKAEEQINKLTKSIEQSPSTIIITDIYGTIEYVNPKFVEITGYTKEEALGQNPRILKSGKMPLEVYEQLWETMSSGNVWRGEFLNKKKNGELYWEWATMASIKNELGVITNYIAIKEDISLRKQMESDLIIAKDKAEESDRLKSAFLANMSHEIRTPLNSIIGFSELLTDSAYEVDQKNEFIHHIIVNGNNLLNIISDIMDISKMESSELKIYKSKISLQKFLSKISSQFAIQFEGKSIEFIVDLPVSDDEVVIFADEDRLMQVFNNLLSNALKFTSEGSIQIGYQSNGEMVEFHVKDTGIGIPAEYHDKIFERFRQVEGAETRKYGGNGLGLAITRNLIHLMGGEIGLESAPGKGSTFYFTIPISN